MARYRGDLPDHDVGSRARDRSEIVMFGEPVADVAERIRMARQIDAVAQRRGRSGARGDDGEVENREWNHGANLVRRAKPTKGPAAQVRHAPAARVPAVPDAGGWDEFSTAASNIILPTRATQDPVPAQSSTYAY